MKRIFKKLLRGTLAGPDSRNHVDRKFDEVRINQGKILARLNESLSSTNIQDYEFSVFSQWGDDGIIQHIVNSVEIKNKTFIEFGVEDFHESNCRYLMVANNWSGFVLDGSRKNIDRLKNSSFFWQYDLKAECAFITKDNIEPLLESSGFESDLGLLHVDLDGNDYYITEAIKKFQPRILIGEFNAVFGPDRCVTVPYRDDFMRHKAHHSNLYYGCSLGALNQLAESRGYCLVGTNSSSNNAYFIKNELLNGHLQKISVRDAFEYSRFKESRDAQGNLTHLGIADRQALIKGMPLIDVSSGETTSC